MRFWCLILSLASLFTFINGTILRCTYPKSEGTGSHSIPRYWYDKSDGTCKLFRFKGQGGNTNNFHDIDTCHKTCICDLPLVKGIGQAKLDRWYHDTKSKTCKPMVYGGSGGNENNFLTLEKCQKTCVDVCKLAPDNKNTTKFWWCMSGNCLTRYSFHSQIGTCETAYFYKNDPKNWNGNSFKTDGECVEKCACKYQKSVQNASKPSSDTRWYLDGNTQECQLGIGNGDSDNRFPTSYDCNGACVCNLPPASGPGQKFTDMFFYNPITEACETFSYGGTGGNANRFKTKEICVRKCGCRQKLNVGTGSKKIIRYYFDQYRGCKVFAYKGSGGNLNKFETAHECAATCGVCDTDPEPLPRASIKKPYYYFDKKDQKCKAFANGYFGLYLNNFGTLEACVTNCGCGLPKDVGTGSKNISRYYYDSSQGFCHSLFYKGSGGNANSFNTIEECQGVCACGLPFNPGQGGGRWDAYYFDAKDRECRYYKKPPAGGNDNSFDSVKKCRNTCICNMPMDDGDYVSDDIQRYAYDKDKKDCFPLTKGYEGGNANTFSHLVFCRSKCK